MKKKLIYLIAILLCTPQQQSHAQAELFAISEFSNLVSDTASEIRQVVTTLEDSGTALSFNVRSDLIVLAQNLEAIQKRIADQSLDRVDTTVQSALQKVNLIVKDFNSGTSDNLSKIEGLSLSIGEVLSRIPGVSDEPFVLHYDPSLAVGDSNAKIRFTIQGTLLGGSSPKLDWGNRSCALKTLTERQMEFDCPASKNAQGDDWRTGTLELKHGGFLIFFRETKKYNLSVRTVPELLGTYKFLPKEEVEAITTVPRQQNNAHRNPHCSGNRSLTWTYTPGPNCKIDVSSVTARATVKSSKSSFGGVSNLTSSGFAVRGSANNSGKCVKLFGQRAAKDGRGSLHVEAKWKDICKTTQEKDLPNTVGDLKWGIDVPLNANKVSNFTLQIQRADGKVKVITGDKSGALNMGALDWLDIRWQPGSGVLVVSPKPLEKAFQ